MQIPMPGGVTALKLTESDTDEEAVAARNKIKQDLLAQEAIDIKAEEEAKKRKAELDIRDQVLPYVCHEEDLKLILDTIPFVRPETFEERMDAGNELREKAKEHWQTSELRDATKYWLAALHAFDFTPKQMKKLMKRERLKVYEAQVPLLANLSQANLKLEEPTGAVRAAEVGLNVAQKLPYNISKPLVIKMRLRRALAKGELRDFACAAADARHVLQLSSDDEEALVIARNCEAALKRESGPEEERWKGSLTAGLVKKPRPQEEQQPQPPQQAQNAAPRKGLQSGRWQKLAIVLVGPLLAVFAMRIAGLA